MSITVRTHYLKDGSLTESYQADAGRDPITGKRRRKSFSLKRDALEWLRSGAHAKVPTGKLTVRELARKFLEECKANELERSTYTKYEEHFRNHLNPLLTGDAQLICTPLGDALVGQLQKRHLAAARTKLSESLSPSMFKKVWLTLKLALDFAVEIEEIPFNRLSLLKKKRRKRQKSKRFKPRNKQIDKIPTEHDLGILLSAIKQYENNEPTLGQVFVALMVGAGLRPSEIRALTWRDILLNGASPCVVINKRADAYGLLGDPKSDNAYRDVPLTPELVAMLRAWREVCPKNAVVEVTRGRRGTKSERKELKNLNPKDLVFPTEHGTYQNPSNIHNRIWVPLQQALRLTDPVLTASGDHALDDEGKPLFKHRYTLYSLRHVYASVKIKLGTDLKRLQVLMGHDSIQLTLDTYGHLWKDEKADRRDAEKLDSHYAALMALASK